MIGLKGSQASQVALENILLKVLAGGVGGGEGERLETWPTPKFIRPIADSCCKGLAEVEDSPKMANLLRSGYTASNILCRCIVYK